LRGIYFPIDWSFGIGVSYPSIYILALGFIGLAAIFKKAELLACSSSEGVAIGGFLAGGCTILGRVA
jgi:hypothetical protein